jgi:hypothetical protein
MRDRGRAFLIGGLTGALLGLADAWLYLRSAHTIRRSDPALPAPADLIKLGLSIAGILRQISALGRGAAV